MEFCSQVKESDNGWQIGLTMFTGDKKRLDTARFFALQVIDSQLTRLNADEVKYVRDSLSQYIQKSIQTDEVEASHMRNKLAQTVAYLFVIMYPDTWTTFFEDLLSLAVKGDNAVGNAQAVDLYLRVLRVVHEEIGDNLIIRPVEQTKRNNLLKDLVRERSMAKLTASWQAILEYYPNATDVPQALRDEIVENALRVLAGWVSWVDIGLIVTEPYLRLIFDLMAVPKQRLAVCDTLYEIVAKKMRPTHKKELIELINLPGVLSRLPKIDDIEFDERLAKLVNVFAMELVHICDGSMAANSNTVPLHDKEVAEAEQHLIDLMPFVFQSLANEYDDTSVEVLPCVSEYLQYVRREVKTRGGNSPEEILEQRVEILRAMLEKIVLKMKYDVDSDWTNDDDDTDGEFMVLRAKLKVLQDQIAGIDENMFLDAISSVVVQSLTSSKQWQDIELGLFELNALGDAIKNGSIVVGRGQEASSRAHQTLHELFEKMVRSDLISFNHPSIQLWYMELVNKHSSFFNSQRQDLLSQVLEVFVSPLGVHNPNNRVRIRSWYLFFKLLKTVRRFVGDVAENVFNSISSLLEIRAELPKRPEDSDSEMSSDEATDAHSDAQLYLFELCGMLFASTNNEEHGRELTARFLQALYSDIERNLNGNTQDPQVQLQVHHDIRAIGTFARGFEDALGESATQATSSGIQESAPRKKAVAELHNSAQVIVVVLERMPKAEILRESARYTFSRLVPLLGTEILGHISTLINALLNDGKADEMGDFLSFLGQLTHAFRGVATVFEMFTSLFSPLIEKVLFFISTGGKADDAAIQSSTDVQLMKRELKKSYLGFLFNILNNGFGAVMVAEQNRSSFQAVLESIILYSGDITEPTVQKHALVALNKMLMTWGNGVVAADATTPGVEFFGLGLPVPGFEEQNLFEQYSQVCWSLPTKPGFNPRDAQLRIALGEAAALLKALFDFKGQSYATYLDQVFLPQLGMPKPMADEFIQNLGNLKPKDFRKFYVDFISRA